MSNVLNFKKSLEQLEAKRLELLDKRNNMPDNCLMKDWFEVCNDIRAVEMQIREI